MLMLESITIGEEEDLSKYDFASIVLKWQLTPYEEGKLREVEAEEEGGPCVCLQGSGHD